MIYKEKLIYQNPLESASDIKDFVLEGKAVFSFENNRLRMKNALPAENGQKANFVFWCNKEFPSDLAIEWDFLPLEEPGLAMIFFSAMGKNHSDLFDTDLQKRTGEYVQYHHGDINAFHLSYFRRKEIDERTFHTCNLRKSYGFHLVAQGADPIPDAKDCKDPFRMKIVKFREKIIFSINGLNIFEFADDGSTFGPFLKNGRIGFRQLAPMVAEYSNLKVYELIPDDV